MPYWFVLSGLVLGIGSIVQHDPLAAACAAIAGVAAALLYHLRARHYRGQARTLRERLRVQRMESANTIAGLEENLRALSTQIWELRFAEHSARIKFELAAAKMYEQQKARAEALPTQPLDLAELQSGSAFFTESLAS